MKRYVPSASLPSSLQSADLNGRVQTKKAMDQTFEDTIAYLKKYL